MRIAISGLLIVVSAIAAPRPAEETLAAAGRYLPVSAAAGAATVEDAGALRVVSRGDGWVLATADDALRPILGWGSGPWCWDSLPPQLVEQAGLWREEAVADDGLGGPWPAARAAAASPVEVGPLMAHKWSQGSPWNKYCPADPAGPGGHAYAGCVAVAFAQVLDYLAIPGKGDADCYRCADYGQICSEMLPDWQAAATVGWTDAAARGLLAAGVSVRMNYGPTFSTASTTNIIAAGGLNWCLDPALMQLWRRYYADEPWHDLLQGELDAGRPMVYRGSGSGGHAFNLDGYRVDDLGVWYHVNWGWGGSYNGWYSIDALSPGGRDFTGMQAAVLNFREAEPLLVYPTGDDAQWKPAVFYWRGENGHSWQLKVADNQALKDPVIDSGWITDPANDDWPMWVSWALEPGREYWWQVRYEQGEYGGRSELARFRTKVR